MIWKPFSATNLAFSDEIQTLGSHMSCKTPNRPP